MSDSRVKTLSSTSAASISQTNTENDSSSDDDWTLQIKMVGEQHADFSITLHPEDDIIQLYNEVTNITGLPQNQQRLIYRGRLLPNSNTLLQQQQQSQHSKRKSVAASNNDESLLQPGPAASQPKTSAMSSTHSSSSSSRPLLNQKIKDIVGLMNGHSIHLVCRPKDENRNETEVTTDDDEENDEEGTPATNNSSRDTDPASASSASSTSSTASSSLLAALLGLGGSSTPSSDRGTSYQSQRRHAYRLTEEDLVRPDPGSMETVRQGLMTFHTLQQATPTAAHRNQLAMRRHFYLGQWIDCRDTVNQWLEATVVSILYPRDIMHLYHSSDPSSDQSSSNTGTYIPTFDPPVAVTDFDGRRRLLLEPCSESESEECIDGVHYRRRSNNDQVQILHIHYNGWPVRWDEWIRSDSERLRVFRTRTRHNTNTSQIHASPNIDSTMPDAPRTYFSNTDNETIDRRALLPELHRAISTLQNHLNVATATNTNSTLSINTSTSSSRMAHLPWTGETSVPSTTSTEASLNTLSSRRQKQRELEALAPLLDRLGRVLIDAAPHVLALSESIGQEDDEDQNQGNVDDASNDLNDVDVQDETEQQNNTHPSTLGGLLSLLSRDRRSSGQRGSVASSNAALPSVVSDVEMSVASSTTDGIHPEPPTATSSSINIVDPDDEDDENNADDEEIDDGVELDPIDPDYRDYAGGLVNTFRGETRNVSSSSNSNTTPSNRRSSDDGTSLLGAYLAAMSLSGLTSISASDGEGGGVTEGLGRLLRDRGNGSGIDIHIHAVVTAPGLDGAIGIAALTGGGGGTTFPAVATPVTTNGTATATTNGGLGSLLFGGATRESNRRSGSSRRFRANTPGPVDATVVEQQTASGITNIIDDDTDLFAELYSETPDPINPNGQADHVVPTSTVAEVPNDDTSENNLSGTPTSSPSRLQRSRSRSRVVSNSLPSLGENLEQHHSDGTRTHRNDRNASNGSNNNLLRRIFRRPDGTH